MYSIYKQKISDFPILYFLYSLNLCCSSLEVLGYRLDLDHLSQCLLHHHLTSHFLVPFWYLSSPQECLFGCCGTCVWEKNELHIYNTRTTESIDVCAEGEGGGMGVSASTSWAQSGNLLYRGELQGQVETLKYADGQWGLVYTGLRRRRSCETVEWVRWTKGMERWVQQSSEDGKAEEEQGGDGAEREVRHC